MRIRKVLFEGEKLSELSYDEFRELVKYAISRLDGAWFRAVAEKYGIPEAVDLDVKVWEDLTERVARKIKKTLKSEGKGIESVGVVIPKIIEVWGELMGSKGEILFAENKVISRVSQCGYWENIKKAGFGKFAEAGLMCSRVHVAGYTGLFRGAFPDLKFEFTHSKRIPSGDPCCEMIIRIIP
jgi:hypothetical protein